MIEESPVFGSGEYQYILYVKDIREAVRKLKDKIIFNDIYTSDEIFRLINEEFGEKLI